MDATYRVYRGTLGPEAPCVYLVGVAQGEPTSNALRRDAPAPT